MKPIYPLSLLLLTLGTAAYAGDPALTNDKEKISYIVGLQMGSQLKRSGMEIDIKSLSLAIKDMLDSAPPRLTDTEIQLVVERDQRKKAAAMKSAGDDNAKEGKEFLAQNGAKPGVTKLPNGLQYKVIKNGKGKRPVASDNVTVNYRGTLINGNEFDSSYRRGEPATFGLANVIPGWTQVLQLMQEGSKWEVVIPPELAYGSGGAGQMIGPNATLIFEIELIKVN